MLAKLKALFSEALGASTDEGRPLEARLQVASAILLLEVARTDHHIEAVELAAIKRLIQSKFNLSTEETDALMDEADDEIDTIVDFHQFTSLLNEHFSVEQKIKLVEYMWQIALSDGSLDGYEDQFIRKIADLLYLRHAELLSARERARQSIG